MKLFNHIYYLLVFLITLFITTFVNAQDFQGLIRISPENPIETDEVSIEFITGCRSWDNHDFIVSGDQVNYSVDYSDCLILPTPEFYLPYSIGFFDVGDYTVEMSINNVLGDVVEAEIFTFSVGSGSTVAVPMSGYSYLLIVILFLFLTSVHLRFNRKC